MSRVPPHASSSAPQGQGEELEHLEELGDDAIIAHEQGAHAPAPRAQVTEEARSVVISDHPVAGSPGSNPPELPQIPTPAKKRSEGRSEKTVVIRDRRQLDELRREMAKRKPQAVAPTQGIWLWVIVGIVAFMTGGVVALFATRDDASVAVPSAAPSAELAPTPAAPTATAEPPKVSIDELPIEGSKK